MVWRCYQYSPSHSRKCSECGKRGTHFYKPDRSSRTAICPPCFGKNHPELARESFEASVPAWVLESGTYRKYRNFCDLSHNMTKAEQNE